MNVITFGPGAYDLPSPDPLRLTQWLGNKTESKAIKLIDYDGMFVPEIESLGASEIGHVNFQHPQRDKKYFSTNLDTGKSINLSLFIRKKLSFEKSQLSIIQKLA